VNFGVGKKGLCWSYLARASPKAKREIVPGVVAIRCDLAAKDMLTETAPERFFDDDHYRGYPAILARLEALDVPELEGLIRSAWAIQAPKSLQKGSA
jgi:hypothetical protein